MNYFTSDLHLGHTVITKYRPQFSTQEEHDEAVFDLFAKLNKRDIVFIHGDFIFDSPNYEYYVEQFSKFPCRIKLIMGNHDSLRLYKESKFEVQLPLFSYKNMWMSHCPVHSQELRNRTLNIHGHLHGSVVKHCDGEIDERYYNVNLDNNDFTLVPYDKILERVKEVR